MRGLLRRVGLVTAVGITPALLGGCATAYAPKNATGGYVENWRSPSELEIEFHHNGYLTVEDARDLAMRRAAELALEAGRHHFRVWGERLHEQKFHGPQYAAIQVQLLEGREEGALDAVQVVRDTDTLAGGRLSSRARERLRTLTLADP